MIPRRMEAGPTDRSPTLVAVSHSPDGSYLLVQYEYSTRALPFCLPPGISNSRLLYDPP